MPNRLADQVSPYLLQHKDNPVDWWPWGPEAFAEARSADKPVLLSIGYAACHWCHVMAHESFEDSETAALMNDLYINIKVDREERPDIDQIYMAALHATGEQGGWPLTMVLTPDGHPVWGGTYFPPAPRFGRPGFPDVLREIARIFRDEPDRVAAARTAILISIATPPAVPDTAPPVGRELLDVAADRLLAMMDPVHGGTRGAPKFPQMSLAECLARAGDRTGDPRYAGAVELALTSICQGGIYDHIGGGFARYATDERWLVPHFEKMLYDNAQIVEQLAFSCVRTHNPLFAERIDETIAWLDRDMTAPDGGFASSLDADSEGEEGRYYVWTPPELSPPLSPDDARRFAAAYDISADGNWEGKSIPNRLRSEPFSETDSERFAVMRQALLAKRTERVPPARDDKVLADWNGLAVSAVATAGFVLDRDDWIALARRTYDAVVALLGRDARLGHAYRAGRTVFPGLATDYAFLIKAALALYGFAGVRSFLDDALGWIDAVRLHHRDTNRPGYFLSADDADDLITRPRSDVDDAVPAATSIMVQNLVRAWHLTGDDDYRSEADAILEASGHRIAANVYASAGLLNALDLRLRATLVVLVAPDGESAGDLLAAIRRDWTPNTVLSVFDGVADLPPGHPASGKSTVAGRAAAYVCRDGICSLPVTDPADLARLLQSSA